jgi:hypothetical protein
VTSSVSASATTSVSNLNWSFGEDEAHG